MRLGQVATRLLREQIRPQNEPSAYLRAQILFLAMQGEFPALPDMLLIAMRDPESHVRLAAVKGLRRCDIPGRRDLLVDRLRTDTDLFVRIEVAKTMARIGNAQWARPLIEVVLESTENYNLRAQCHLAALKLTGADVPFLQEDWRKWLSKHNEGRGT